MLDEGQPVQHRDNDYEVICRDFVVDVNDKFQDLYGVSKEFFIQITEKTFGKNVMFESILFGNYSQVATNVHIIQYVSHINEAAKYMKYGVNSTKFLTGLQYLQNNFHKFGRMIKDIVDDSVKNLNDYFSVLQQHYITNSVIAISLGIFILVLMIPHIIQINTYVEKILMLILRINMHECETEIAKFQYFNDILNDLTQKWLRTEYMKILNHKIEVDVNMEEKLKTEKSVVLSGKIFEQKLTVVNRSLALMVWPTIITVYFIVALIVIFVSLSSMNTVLDVNTRINQATINLSQAYVEMQLLTSSDLYTKANTDFEYWPPLSKAEYIKELAENIDGINAFMNDYIKFISKKSTFSPHLMALIQTLLKGNLCSIMSTNMICDNENKRFIYEQGILGVLNGIKKLIETEEYFFSSNYKEYIPPAERI